jgi:predicted phosphohydrolase
MSDLILNVKRKWFDLIKSGIKTREFREIKPYWTKRLQRKYDHVVIVSGYPHVRDESNSVVFPWKGYVLTSVGRNEILYGETIHTLNITGPETVYGIKLELT